MKQAFLEECEQNLSSPIWGGMNTTSFAHSIMQGLARKSSLGPFWIICPNESVCEKMLEALHFFNQFCRAKTEIGHYIQDDPRTFDGSSPSPQCPRKRIHARLLLTQKNSVIVSSVLGALHKTLSLEDTKQQSLILIQGEEYVKNDILEQLHTIGYRVESPSEAGSYLFRGDTLLIWPNGKKHPYRISFFDEEVESIHLLSPNSHSKLSSVSSIAIIPCKEAIVTPRSLQKLGRTLHRSVRKHPQKREEATRVRTELGQGFWFPGAEDYLPLLWDLQSPLQEAKTIFLLSPAEIKDKCAYWDQQLPARWMHIEEEEQPMIDPNLRFSTSQSIYSQQTLAVQQLQGDGLFFNIQPPKLSIAKIDALKDQLKEWLDQDWDVMLVTPSTHQLRKIKNIIRDIPFSEMHLDKQVHTQTIQHTTGNLLEGYVDTITQRVILCANDLFPTPITKSRKTLKQATLQSYTDLKIGDYVVHKIHGIGRFLKLSSMLISGHPIECIEIEYQNEATVLVPLNRMDQLYRYRSVGNKEPKIDKLGGKSWQNKMAKVKSKVLAMAHQLMRIHAKRAASTGHAYNIDLPQISQFADRFPYEETPDQENAIKEILQDLAREKQMDRLLIGDVGFGKTEVAMRAAMCVVASGHQVAFLCPTTILAMQHHRTFKQRFAAFGIEVALVSRLQSEKEKKDIYRKLAKGEIHIIIGTHALLNKRIQFQHLGLVIADEEHRFGVVQKEKLRALGQLNAEQPAKYLAMSATPIPRTLHMAFSGIRDVSIIATPPPGRQPIETLTIHESDAKIQQQIRRELQRGGQIFFLHNRVESLPSRVEYLKKLVPEAKICFAHGQQNKNILEQTILGFVRNQYNLLVCTSIIENGVDLPNANTIIIDQAQQLGLAQLYQLRGRVGRSSTKAYCTFVIPKTGLKRTALARLHTLQRHTDLASGFAVASADLELRGSGNLLGKEQSGHIQVVGLDIYIELLEQCVQELQGKDALASFDPEVEIPISASLPEKYIPETEDRLREYQKLSSTQTHSELRELAERWISTYGDLPEQATHLIWNTECQIWCRVLGILKLHWLKSRVLLMLHPHHTLDPKKLERLCTKFPTRITQKQVDTRIELYATFQKEEAQTPFGFLFWLFQELRICMVKPIH